MPQMCCSNGTWLWLKTTIFKFTTVFEHRYEETWTFQGIRGRRTAQEENLGSNQTHRIHVCYIWYYMVTFTINIPPMLAYIPAPWILWEISQSWLNLRWFFVGQSSGQDGQVQRSNRRTPRRASWSRWDGKADGYGSIPMKIPFLGGWTSINPSYFDVNYRGTRFWHTARSWSFDHGGDLLVCGDWNHGILNDFPETVGNVIITDELTPSLFRGVGWNHQPDYIITLY